MNNQVKKNTRRGLRAPQAQELLSPWSWGAPPSWYADVFSHLETLQTSYCWDFMEASSRRDDQLLTPFSAPLTLLEKWWGRGGGSVGGRNSKPLIVA